MKYYQDITLLPDAEANLGFLWHKVYQQIHIALADNKIAENCSAIGLSIPEYCNTKSKVSAFPLGKKIRLMAEEQSQLEKIDIAHWLKRFQDYVHIKSIQSVPTGITKYACFTRKHVKGEARTAKSIESKAKHQAEKFNVSYEECLKKLKDNVSLNKRESLPFIQVRSLSSNETQGGRLFPMFIKMELVDTKQVNHFNCYGLSLKEEGKEATVPWF